MNIKILKLRDRILIIVFIIVLGTVAVKAIDNKIGQNEMSAKDKAGACPKDMVLVANGEKNFCIDKFEESAGKNCIYTDPQNQSDTRINIEHTECMPTSEPNKMPWRFISQDQAVLACAKAGKRLPTSEEWYKAALGTPDRSSGWGSDDCQVSNNWLSQPGSTGLGKNCVSSAGANDMIGNVWEWVDGIVQDGKNGETVLPESGYVDSTDGNSLPAVTNQETPNPNYNSDYFWIKKNGLRGMARGGYWNNKTDAGLYSLYIVTSPSTAETGIGFRCVKNIY